MADQVDVDEPIGGSVVDAVIGRPQLLRPVALGRRRARPPSASTSAGPQRRARTTAAAIVRHEEPREAGHDDRRTTTSAAARGTSTPRRGRCRRCCRRCSSCRPRADSDAREGSGPVAGPAPSSPARSRGRSSRHSASIGITKLDRSRAWYSTPKNTICGEAWLPTSIDAAESRAGVSHSTSVALPSADEQDERRPQQQVALPRSRPGSRPTCPGSDASSTVLVKKVRNRTCDGNQRMQVSSRKSVSKLIRNKSSLILRSGLDTLYSEFNAGHSVSDPVWMVHRYETCRRQGSGRASSRRRSRSAGCRACSIRSKACWR